jgi:DNA modification methylase
MNATQRRGRDVKEHGEFAFGRQRLIRADCIDWFASAARESVSAVITDPPYGLLEYEPGEQAKLRLGRGGVWRIPPAFDGAKRRALPRFTVLSAANRSHVYRFFKAWATALSPVLLPGAHLFVATSVLVSPIVSVALERAGLERRGEVVRLVRTLRGGDRPKRAEDEFPLVSTMPRGCWEPWAIFRKPLRAGTVAQNLRECGVGGLRRIDSETPFLDVIPSSTTPQRERAIAQHPSLKPQRFLRSLARAALPLGTGLVLDPFAGSGSTLAACEAVGADGIGIERDERYFALARDSIAGLAALEV